MSIGILKLENSRSLKLHISIQLDDGIKALLKTCEDLYLGAVSGVKSILYELNSEGFPLLKHLSY
jgi:hypothetical protein